MKNNNITGKIQTGTVAVLNKVLVIHICRLSWKG